MGEKRGSGGFNRRLRKKDDLLTETTTEVDLESRLRPEHYHHQPPQSQQQNQSVMAPLQSVHTATSSSRRGSNFEPWNLGAGDQPQSCYISAERRMRKEGSVESFGSQQILVQTTVDVDEKSVDDRQRRRRESEA